MFKNVFQREYGVKLGLSNPELHLIQTEKLAKLLLPKSIYEWIMKDGYYPESYVLPPCFKVEKYPAYGKKYFTINNGRIKSNLSSLAFIQFPKSNFADRIFGIIDPELHCDIAYEISSNWKSLLKIFFNPNNKVFCYSFPIPLDKKSMGKVGKLRSGRMIYEFIEMAENDVASEAFKYSYLIIADIKNFYPSIYTHSISWAIHGKSYIRTNKRRIDPNLLGNRIDHLFQYSNDGKTNGIAIGPVVSDIISEIILAKVDVEFSNC